MKTAALVLPLAFGLTGVATPETVAWEAYALVGPGRELLGKGVKSYSPAKDIVVEEQGTDGGGSPAWQKSLLLDETFALSASVHREASLDGFGLVIFRRGDANGFSWEWFDRVQGNVFARRQGSGRVAITIKKAAGLEELESVEFLADATLRYLDDMKKPPGTHTHEVVIRKGSVFRITPPAAK